MIAKKLKAFLDENAVRYITVQHSPAFTASEVAASAHLSARDFAKTVIITIENSPAMLVLPASRRILIHELRDMLLSENVRFATEADLRKWFPDCELGAMPPFGNLYDMPVHVTASVARQKEIAFNAGTHTEVIKMDYADFERLVHPLVIDLVTT